MKNNKILVLALLLCVTSFVSAQNTENSFTGIVIDKWGNPVYGASVNIKGEPNTKVETDRNGKFTITVTEEQIIEIVSINNGSTKIKVGNDKAKTIVMDYAAQMIDMGTDKVFTRSESTASVATVHNEDFNNRSSKNISNSLFGWGLGLISLQNSGNYAAVEPTFYVRGLQSLSSSSPLFLVDGLERDISQVIPEEVESVSILKDAPSLALYGYKGINGAILITTKRGKYNTKSIRFSYDHIMNSQLRRPKFADAYTYAMAVNEARGYEELSPRYVEQEVNAFRSGEYPYWYADVDWLNETFKNSGISNKYTMELQGGGSKFRYYTMLGLVTDQGFVKKPRENEGYSTQNQYSKANLRTNLDIDLTNTTKLRLNILGTLGESNRPGDSADLWDMIYSLPAVSFPVRTETGVWGGNATWAGTLNPVAQSQGAAYSKGHTRNLFADLTLTQDLSDILNGLGANFRMAYDNYSSIWENHSKTYSYEGYNMRWADDGPIYTLYNGGADSEMSTAASINEWTRQFNFSGGLTYNRSLGKHDLFSQMKWEYEYRDSYGLNTTIYRQNGSWYTHYGYNNRYYANLILAGSASSLLAPGHKWAFSPTVSAGWVLSEEDFMKNVSWLNFLKLRTSWGIINADYLPKDGSNAIYNYWDQIYTLTGTRYMFNGSYDSSFGSTYIGRLATINSSHEKAFKYNVGLESTLLNSLNVSLESYYQHRTGIWVSSAGKYTSVLGMDAPFENEGIVDSWGIEVGLDYTKKIGEVVFNAGGNFNWNKNEIKEQLEEPRMFENLNQTGHPVNQIFGLQAIGFFKDPDDINNSLTQSFSTVKPGDIKYKDINGDQIIDENDRLAIGYSTVAPEIYYSFHLGAEMKGIGISASFQGVANYSAILNTKSMFWPLINNTTISTHYYENRWTPDNQDAKYPRLSSQSNGNNYQNNTIWLANRSFLKLRNLEVYYKFSKTLLQKTKVLSNAKLYLRGIDLLCFDHINVVDPESYGVTNPLNKSMVVGLTIDF
jgi:TonB-linked SusC/RagA family outer membrane protein